MKFKYEASFDRILMEAVGEIEADSISHAGDILRGMCGEWFTESGMSFNAGCPSNFMLSEINRFSSGKTYLARIITDSDLSVFCKITKRSKGFIWFTVDGQENIRKAKLRSEVIDCEWFYPLGCFSMAPICRADNEVKK